MKKRNYLSYYTFLHDTNSQLQQSILHTRISLVVHFTFVTMQNGLFPRNLWPPAQIGLFPGSSHLQHTDCFLSPLSLFGTHIAYYPVYLLQSTHCLFLVHQRLWIKICRGPVSKKKSCRGAPLNCSAPLPLTCPIHSPTFDLSVRISSPKSPA